VRTIMDGLNGLWWHIMITTSLRSQYNWYEGLYCNRGCVSHISPYFTSIYIKFCNITSIVTASKCNLESWVHKQHIKFLF